MNTEDPNPKDKSIEKREQRGEIIRTTKQEKNFFSKLEGEFKMGNSTKCQVM